MGAACRRGTDVCDVEAVYIWYRNSDGDPIHPILDRRDGRLSNRRPFTKMTLGNWNGNGYPYQCDAPAAATNGKQSNSLSSFTDSAMFGVTQRAVTTRGRGGGGGSVVVGGQSITCGVGGDGCGGDDDDNDGDNDDYEYDDDYDYDGQCDHDHIRHKQEREGSFIAHHSHRFIDKCKLSAKAMMLKLVSTTTLSTSKTKKNISSEIFKTNLVEHHIPAGGGSWDGGSDYYSTGYPSKSRHASPPGDGYVDRGHSDGRATKLFPFFEFTSIIPKLFKASLASMVVLYALNQSHILPRYAPKLSAWTSRVLFWPTLPITAGRRIGEWSTVIDDTVVLGGAPFAIFDLPKKLQQDYGVEAVINFCQEYRGPLKVYEHLGIKELYLPTIDHFEPSATDLYDALTFLQECQRNDKTVYVHCRAGHGRSGACTLSWLMLQDMIKNNNDQSVGKDWIEWYHDYHAAHLNPKFEHPMDVYKMWKLNRELGTVRKVRSSLWKQPNIWRVKNAIKLYASDYRNLPARRENSDLDKFLQSADEQPSSSPLNSSEL